MLEKKIKIRIIIGTITILIVMLIIVLLRSSEGRKMSDENLDMYHKDTFTEYNGYKYDKLDSRLIGKVLINSELESWVFIDEHKFKSGITYKGMSHSTDYFVKDGMLYATYMYYQSGPNDVEIEEMRMDSFKIYKQTQDSFVIKDLNGKVWVFRDKSLFKKPITDFKKIFIQSDFWHWSFEHATILIDKHGNVVYKNRHFDYKTGSKDTTEVASYKMTSMELKIFLIQLSNYLPDMLFESGKINNIGSYTSLEAGNYTYDIELNNRRIVSDGSAPVLENNEELISFVFGIVPRDKKQVTISDIKK